MNKIALRINVCAADWTAKKVIIASNVTKKIAIELRAIRMDNRRIIGSSVVTCCRQIYIAENRLPSRAIIRLEEMVPANLVMDSKLNMIVRA